jgi:hypothetical protein
VVGVVGQLIGDCPGKADVFKHVPARYHNNRCEAAVNNALGKIGLSLNRIKGA